MPNLAITLVYLRFVFEGSKTWHLCRFVKGVLMDDLFFAFVGAAVVIAAGWYLGIINHLPGLL